MPSAQFFAFCFNVETSMVDKLPLLCAFLVPLPLFRKACTNLTLVEPTRSSFEGNLGASELSQELGIKIAVSFLAVFTWSVTRVALMSICVVLVQSAWNDFCVTWFYYVVVHLPSSQRKGLQIHQAVFVLSWKLQLPHSVVKKSKWNQKITKGFCSSWRTLVFF